MNLPSKPPQCRTVKAIEKIGRANKDSRMGLHVGQELVCLGRLPGVGCGSSFPEEGVCLVQQQDGPL